jgi:excisionase family DNA binding protein
LSGFQPFFRFNLRSRDSTFRQDALVKQKGFFAGPWYLLREVAALLRVSVSTVRRVIRAGRVPIYRIPTRGGSNASIRIHETHIKEFLLGPGVPTRHFAGARRDRN